MSRTGTKARMTESAIALLREQGVPGVTIDAVLAHSGAPRGSVYHHFPGGRAELVLTAGRTAADFITELLREATSAGDPRQALEGFAAFWRASLEASDHRAGCPIVALAVGSRADEGGADDLVHETFARWQEQLGDLFRAQGRAPQEAAALATLVVAALEGAVVLCKAERSAEPLDRVTEQLLRLL